MPALFVGPVLPNYYMATRVLELAGHDNLKGDVVFDVQRMPDPASHDFGEYEAVFATDCGPECAEVWRRFGVHEKTHLYFIEVEKIGPFKALPGNGLERYLYALKYLINTVGKEYAVALADRWPFRYVGHVKAVYRVDGSDVKKIVSVSSQADFGILVQLIA